MAKKMKLMPLFQELKGRAEISNRRPAATSPGVYLMQLREHSGPATLPRRRLVVSINPSGPASLPHPVKITHVQTVDAAPSPGARPERQPTNRPPQVRPGAA